MSGLTTRLRLAPGLRARGSRVKWDALARWAMVMLALLFVAALLGQVVGLGGSPTALVGPRLAPPGPDWILGTDSLGRSLLPRLLQGITTTLVLSATAVAVTAVLSTVFGIVAGYHGGLVGGLVMRIGDILYAFPALVLAILVASIVGPGYVAALCSIILVTVPLMTRMVGAASRDVARREFITSAIVGGVSAPRIMARHVLRNVSGTIAVQGTYALSVAILVEGGLSFLGYGVQLPGSSLGLLVQEGSVYVVKAPLLLLAPGLVMVLAILCINLIGDSLSDRFEPREVRSFE